MLAWEQPTPVVRRARGAKGLWRLLDRGTRWELTLQPARDSAMVSQGVFDSAPDAAGHAQFLEDEARGYDAAQR